MNVKYPAIKVRLTGQDGNAYGIIGAVEAGLRSGGVPTEERMEFRRECMSGDYDALLQTCMKWVNVS